MDIFVGWSTWHRRFNRRAERADVVLSRRLPLRLVRDVYDCPVCSFRGRFAASWETVAHRRAAQCPKCGASERHRVQSLVRTQRVYDLDAVDAPEAAAKIDELLASERFATFAPDTLVEARNRGYRPDASVVVDELDES